jgi:ligand-binding sensor domain-containing protein/signal transduction histidine kinase
MGPKHMTLEFKELPSSHAESAPSLTRSLPLLGSDVEPRGVFHKQILSLIKPLFFLLLWVGPAVALDPGRPLSQFTHELWSTENGLPQNTVHAITQTSDGFIWIATEEGLARFDGFSFTVFDTQNTPQFKSNDVRALAEDHHGVLWIGTVDGLVQLQNGKFKAFEIPGGSAGNKIASIYEDRTGSLWVATSAGLGRIKEGSVTTFAAQDGLPVNSVFEDQQGSLWAGTSAGASQFKEGRFINFSLPPDVANRSVTAIVQDKDGRLWFGTPTGLALFDNGRFQTYTIRDGLPNDRIVSLRLDAEGTLWCGTAAGLTRYKDGRFAVFDSVDGLASSTILSVFEDREGSVWIGTESGGLHLLKDKKFTTYTRKDGLAGDLVKSIYEDRNGNIWIGTNGAGLNLFKDEKFTTFTTKDGLSSDVVLALYGEDDGSLWVGTPDGLNRLKDGKITTFTTAEGLSNDFVRSIYADRHGNLWVGTRGGLNRFRDGHFKIYTTTDGLPNDFVGTVYEDSAGSLWIGTLGGLSKFKDETFTTYTTKDGLASDVVLSLYEDRDGILWIGTNGGGLNRLKDGKFTAYTTKDGLVDDVVYRVLEDGQANLWLSSNKGIFRVSKKDLDDFANGKVRSLTPVVYGTADGMMTRECSGGGHPSGWKSSDGKLWFSTIKGVAMIDPQKIKINQLPPPVALEQVRVDDQIVDMGQKIELSPGKTRFEFSYAGLSFIAPEKVRFRYKLEGFDKDWIEGGTRRIAYYTNLPAGDYKFRVMASNNDGIWNQTGASFELYLKPHFYQTIWFYAVCVLVMALLVWQLYRLRVQQVESRFAAVLAERNRIAREIHDNLAQEMLGISVQLELVTRLMAVSTEKAKTHLDRARILVRNSVAEARRYVWDLRSQALEKNDLPTALNETARRLTADTSVQAQVQVSGTFRPLNSSIEDNLLRIGQEAINNAMKHGQAGRILINLSFDAKNVRLSVRDDGHGFDAAAQTTEGRFGLVGMRERAEQIGGRLSISSENGSGTEVIVDVPIGG